MSVSKTCISDSVRSCILSAFGSAGPCTVVVIDKRNVRKAISAHIKLLMTGARPGRQRSWIRKVVLLKDSVHVLSHKDHKDMSQLRYPRMKQCAKSTVLDFVGQTCFACIWFVVCCRHFPPETILFSAVTKTPTTCPMRFLGA